MSKRHVYHAHNPVTHTTSFVYGYSLEEAKAGYALANLGDPDEAEWKDTGEVQEE